MAILEVRRWVWRTKSQDFRDKTFRCMLSATYLASVEGYVGGLLKSPNELYVLVTPSRDDNLHKSLMIVSTSWHEI